MKYELANKTVDALSERNGQPHSETSADVTRKKGRKSSFGLDWFHRLKRNERSNNFCGSLDF